MGSETNTARKLKNDLSQASVPTPLLFSMYIAEMSEMTSTKFGYADEWTQIKSVEEAGEILTRDLKIVGRFFGNDV